MSNEYCIVMLGVQPRVLMSYYVALVCSPFSPLSHANVDVVALHPNLQGLDAAARMGVYLDGS